MESMEYFSNPSLSLSPPDSRFFVFLLDSDTQLASLSFSHARQPPALPKHGVQGELSEMHIIPGFSAWKPPQLPGLRKHGQASPVLLLLAISYPNPLYSSRQPAPHLLGTVVFLISSISLTFPTLQNILQHLSFQQALLPDC